jgi:hypothetical protein
VNELVGVHPNAYRSTAPYGLAHRSQAFHNKPHTVLDASTKFVRPTVEVRRQKRLTEHAMCCVDFNPVISGLSQMTSRCCVSLNKLLDRRTAHFVRDMKIVRNLNF